MNSRFALCMVTGFLLGACAAPPALVPEAVPHAIELQETRAIATIHFAPGVYYLDASDRTGYYYRAPEGVIQHTFGGFTKHEGGIFLARGSGRLRGYVIWGGGRTKIGDLTRAYHVFR